MEDRRHRRGDGPHRGYRGLPPRQLTPAGQRVFFVVNPADTGTELWVSDGTETGTRMLSDLIPGEDDDFISPTMAAMGDKLLFVREETGELWISDGTPAGTTLLHELEWHFFSPRWPIIALGSRALLFTGEELWITDGTPAGTARVTAVNTYSASTRPVAYQGFVYFAANAGSTTELWRTDGTEAGTTRVLDAAGHAIVEPQALAEFAGKLVFIAPNGLDVALWTSDGSPAGTAPLRDVQIGHFNQEFPWELVKAGDRLFFRAQDPATGWELWALRP